MTLSHDFDFPTVKKKSCADQRHFLGRKIPPRFSKHVIPTKPMPMGWPQLTNQDLLHGASPSRLHNTAPSVPARDTSAVVSPDHQAEQKASWFGKREAENLKRLRKEVV